jgi:hypothetical protein
MQSRPAQIPPIIAVGHRLLRLEQPHDDIEALLQQSTRLRLGKPDHRTVGRQRARTSPEHHAPPRQVIEQDDALRYPKRVVVGKADNARSEPDVPGPLRRDRDEDLRRRTNFRPC